jgi:hypothetical protein
MIKFVFLQDFTQSSSELREALPVAAFGNQRLHYLDGVEGIDYR